MLGLTGAYQYRCDAIVLGYAAGGHFQADFAYGSVHDRVVVVGSQIFSEECPGPRMSEAQIGIRSRTGTRARVTSIARVQGQHKTTKISGVRRDHLWMASLYAERAHPNC